MERAPTTHKDIVLIEKEVRSLTNSLSAMKFDIEAKNKRLNHLDLKSRELNLLIDGMIEIANEDTIDHVCGFWQDLSHTSTDPG